MLYYNEIIARAASEAASAAAEYKLNEQKKLEQKSKNKFAGIRK